MVTAWGVDYAWSKPRPSVLAQQGRTFACRYGGTGIDDSKMLTASELAALTAAGISVVANVEGAPSGFKWYSGGQDWARRGVAWFKALGMPSDRPIYFSADWDVTSGDWPALKAALDGAASVIGRNRVGLYGGRYAIQKAKDTGAAAWLWQTYAWSGQPTQWVSGTHLQQYRNGVTIDGADCDLDRAMTDDFGQWGYKGDDMNLTDKIGSKAWPDRTLQDFLNDVEGLRDVLRGDQQGAKVAAYPGSSPLMELLGTPDAVTALSAKVDALSAKVDALAQQQAQPVSQDALTAAVSAGFGTILADLLQVIQKGQTA